MLEEIHQLDHFSRVGVAKEYGPSDDSSVEYYVVRLEEDLPRDALHGGAQKHQVYAFAEASAGTVEKAERFTRWASMKLVNLARFESHQLGRARQEAAMIRQLLDFPVVEDLDEGDSVLN